MKTKRMIWVNGWLTTVLLLLVLNLCGQPIRFSNFYDLANGAGGFVNCALIDQDRIIALGSELNLTDNFGYNNGFHQVVDGQGNPVGSTGFNPLGANMNARAVVKSRYFDHLYTAGYVCDYNTGARPCEFYFSRSSMENGDTLFTRLMHRPDTTDYLLNMVETRPNKILLMGWSYNDTVEVSGGSDLLFITVDTLGNELNRVVYGGGSTDYIHSGIVINEMGESLLTGYTKSFGGGDNDSWVLKVDSIGNVLWQETYNHLSPSGGDGAVDVVQLQGGNYVVAGSYDNSSLTAAWGYLMKIDGDGNEIWTKRYDNELSQGFWACEELQEGSIIGVGQTNNTDDGSQAGWLLKADANGDTLWTRTYNSSSNTEILRNMLVMDNGDIVMAGFGWGENSNTQDGWILRVDSMGCVVENCTGSVGVDDDRSALHSEKLSIYPNPAINQLNINLNGINAKESEVVVHNLMGKEVHRFVPASDREIIDVSTWARGIYHCSLYSNQQLLQTEKLILMR